MRIATTHNTIKAKIPTTGAELLRTPTNMPGQYSYTFMAQSTHTTIAFEEIVATNSTILLCNFTLQEVGGRYVAGFQGQHADDEVAGASNSYTAEFWQYDSRLGRRWNVDPVVKPWEGGYATFANNPICFVDPDGLDAVNDENSNTTANPPNNTENSSPDNKFKYTQDIVLWSRIKVGLYRLLSSYKTEKEDIDKFNNRHSSKLSFLDRVLNLDCEEFQFSWRKTLKNHNEKLKNEAEKTRPKFGFTIGLRFNNLVIFDINIGNAEGRYEDHFPGREKNSSFSKRSFQFFYKIRQGADGHLKQGHPFFFGGKWMFIHCIFGHALADVQGREDSNKWWWLWAK